MDLTESQEKRQRRHTTYRHAALKEQFNQEDLIPFRSAPADLVKLLKSNQTSLLVQSGQVEEQREKSHRKSACDFEFWVGVSENTIGGFEETPTMRKKDIRTRKKESKVQRTIERKRVEKGLEVVDFIFNLDLWLSSSTSLGSHL